jgi:hypothetical protein
MQRSAATNSSQDPFKIAFRQDVTARPGTWRVLGTFSVVAMREGTLARTSLRT